METTTALGALGGLLSLVDPVPYLRDVLAGRTRPHRGTWGVWSVLGVTAVAAQAGERFDWSIATLVVQAATITATFVLSLRCGVGGASRRELALLGVAGAGVAAWLLAADPVWAVLGVVTADLAGCVLMLPKSWSDPWSETPSSYAVAGLAGACAAGAVGAGEVAIVYPSYFAVANLGLAAVLLVRRGAVERVVELPAALATERVATG
ncbi:hypothetical protein EV189_3066 [Motilibacter rhizosphaerae]|uniref:PQ loop repeat protein n=1 Tax=Motilibacter rhizosphaerae TaxID=598652 RepID=A0A4Q7NFK3_9ACTN|nr:hypothetical protein [Motilibacter rhizosphaerae]RZS82671.1 hypothetical protein EV189_3066 [Motilibacter rhizosphaerae]